MDRPESVAAHSWRTALLAAALAPEAGLDPARCALLGIVHDLAEAETGDITPCRGLARAEKVRLEREGLERLLALLGDRGGPSRALLREAWEEVASGSTPEGRFVSEADVLERMLQAGEYARSGRSSGDLAEFFDPPPFSFPVLERLRRALVEGRGRDPSRPEG